MNECSEDMVGRDGVTCLLTDKPCAKYSKCDYKKKAEEASKK